ncbi:MAG TPA: hypothetical protein VEK06_04080 [Myxococcota bacterium]|nr:hypothetical protein [Myxococcota bacterium]
MSSHDYQIGAEADLKAQTNKQIWFYFFLFGVLLIAFVGGLIIMYRFTLVYEKQEKVGEVITKESQEQKAVSAALLSGKQGLFNDKRHDSIQAAMTKFLHDARE